MSSMDRLDVLRERNKQLLKQLELQRETLERLVGFSHGRKRGRGERTEEGTEERTEPADILTLTQGHRGLARAALTKPTVRFAADSRETQTDMKSTVPTSSGGTAEHSTPSDLFEDKDRLPQVHNRLPGMGPVNIKSCLVNNSKEQKTAQSRVTFQSDDCEEISSSDRRRLQPLLGYDWIAGVLDAEDSLIDRSDEFFNDLRTFRSLNKDECVHSLQAELSEESQSTLPLLTDEDGPEANMDTHQCTFSYRINSRLFPVPLHSQECCPVCKKHKSSHPHTAAEPALIRVSIPRSTLLPPYKHKPHRRCSFDPSDSLGLPLHCLSGWSNKGQNMLSPPSSLDLRSSLKTKSSAETLEKEPEALTAASFSRFVSRSFSPQSFFFSRKINELVPGAAMQAQVMTLPPNLSASKVSGHQISDVSRLTRHSFQHFSPKRKQGSTSYPPH